MGIAFFKDGQVLATDNSTGKILTVLE
jgi:hypothetical protein